MRFRETNWFKRGMTATEASDAPERDDVAADSERPIEDRYVADDVPIGDSLTFGVHTGVTQSIQHIRAQQAEAVDGASSVPAVAPAQLIAELKGGRGLYVSLALGSVAVLVSALVFLN